MAGNENTSVTFYFDPISPFAWLASRQLARLQIAGQEPVKAKLLANTKTHPYRVRLP